MNVLNDMKGLVCKFGFCILKKVLNFIPWKQSTSKRKHSIPHYPQAETVMKQCSKLCARRTKGSPKNGEACRHCSMQTWSQHRPEGRTDEVGSSKPLEELSGDLGYLSQGSVLLSFHFQLGPKDAGHLHGLGVTDQRSQPPGSRAGKKRYRSNGENHQHIRLNSIKFYGLHSHPVM
jgi:hypothetical protein